MKSREELYEELCDKADALLAKYNPCEIIDGICKRGYFCCDGCNHLVDNKCSIRSLLCKTWLCYEAAKLTDPELIEEFRVIYNEGAINKMMVFRGNLNSILNRDALVQAPWGLVYSIPR